MKTPDDVTKRDDTHVDHMQSMQRPWRSHRVFVIDLAEGVTVGEPTPRESVRPFAVETMMGIGMRMDLDGITDPVWDSDLNRHPWI